VVGAAIPGDGQNEVPEALELADRRAHLIAHRLRRSHRLVAVGKDELQSRERARHTLEGTS
jgi:hypothetical protein